MDQCEKSETSRQLLTMSKLSSSAPDIDQLCHLIDESTFGFQSSTSNDPSANKLSKFRSIPSCQVKAFRSSRLKRLCSSAKKNEENLSLESDDEESSTRSLYSSNRRRFAMRFSLSSSLLNRFRSLSTCHFPPSRRSSHLTSNSRSFHSRHSTSTITLYRTQSTLPTITEEENHSTTTTTNGSSSLSCSLVDTRRTTGNSCNVEELAAYLDNYLYLPKSLSGAAELMYT